MVVIGIDPGLTGAVARLDREGVTVVDIPCIQRGAGTATVKNQVNASALQAEIKALVQGCDRQEVLVMIELTQAMPKQGVATMYSMGHTAGMIEGVVAAMGLPHRLVPAAQWKKAMKIAGGKKSEKKEPARALAQRLYPAAELHLVKHHNRAEAILLARYGWETHA